MDRKHRVNILKDFQPLIEKEDPLAVLVFGSYAAGRHTNQSDIDICIIPRNNSIDDLLSSAWKAVGGKYDLWIFEELPIYLQSKIIDNHEIIYAKSEPEYYEYLYHYRKLSDDYKYRLKVAYGEF